MKKTFIGIGLLLTAIILLATTTRDTSSSESEEKENESNSNSPKKRKDVISETEVNKKIINDTLKELVKKKEYATSADLLSQLISEVIKRTGGNIEILYDAPKNLEELEVALRLLGLYESSGLETIDGDSD